MELRAVLRRLWKQRYFTVGVITLSSLSVIVASSGVAVLGAVSSPATPVQSVQNLFRLSRDPGPPATLLSRFDIDGISASGLCDGIAVARIVRATAGWRDVVAVGVGEAVNDDYFRVLGVVGLRGRPLDGIRRTDQPPIVIGTSLARALFHTDLPLGLSVNLGGRSFIVVGVAPEGFGGIWSPSFAMTQFWIRLADLAGNWLPGEPEPEFGDPDIGTLAAVARVAPGSIRGFEVRLRSLGERLEAAQPTSPPNKPRLFSARRQANILISTNAESYVRPVINLMTLTLLGILIDVFLLVAALFARYASSLTKQLRIRRSLGASALRILPPLLWPMFLLIPVSTMACLPIVVYVLHETSLAFSPELRGFSQLHVGSSTLAVAIAGNLAAACVGVLPSALRTIATRHVGYTAASSRANRAGRALVCAFCVSIALALSAVAGAMLAQLVRTPHGARQIPWSQIQVFGIDSTLMSKGVNRDNFGSRVVAAVQERDNVAAAWFESLGFFAPPYHHSTTRRVSIGGAHQFDRLAFLIGVSRGWNRALPATLLDGRVFTDSEHDHGSAVAIIPQSVARAWWQGHAIGQRLLIAEADNRSPGADHLPFAEVVVIGVVSDWYEPPELAWQGALPLIVPKSMDFFKHGYLLVRGATPRLATMDNTKEAIESRVPGAPVRTQGDVPGLLHAEFALLDRLGQLLFLLAGLALLLAFAAVATLTHDDVVSRKRELAIRAALGARNADLVVLAIRAYVMWLLTAALLTTLFVSWWFDFIRKAILGSMLGRPAPDPIMANALVPQFIAVVLVGVGVAAAGAYRIGRLDPAAAIRQSPDLT